MNQPTPATARAAGQSADELIQTALVGVHREAVTAIDTAHRYALVLDRPALAAATQDVLDALARMEAAL